MTTQKQRNIQFSEYAGYFSNQIKDMDTLRMKSLQRLYKIRNKRKNNQQRQLKYLVEKFGGEHPKALKQAERIFSEKEIENYLSIAIDRTEVGTEIIKGKFTLKGRVFSDNIESISGHSIQLQDAEGKAVGKPVKTDINGKYSMVVNVKNGEQPENLKLTILDEKGIQIHQDELPILLRADVVDLRDVMI